MRLRVLVKAVYEEVLYSPDSTRLAVVGSIGIWLYDTTTYREVALLRRAFHVGSHSVAFSPDGKTLASGSEDHTVRLWDTETWEQKRTLTKHLHDV